MAARWTKLALVAVPALALMSGAAAHIGGEIALARVIFVAGTVPVLAALLGKRFAPLPRGAIAAMVSGGAVAAAGRFFPQWTGHADPVVAGTAVNLIVLLFSVVAARMSRTRPRAPA